MKRIYDRYKVIAHEKSSTQGMTAEQFEAELGNPLEETENDVRDIQMLLRSKLSQKVARGKEIVQKNAPTIQASLRSRCRREKHEGRNYKVVYQKLMLQIKKK